MNRNIWTFIIAEFMTITFAFGQKVELQSYYHGIHFMTGDVSKELIIDDIKFADGVNKELDVIRFDNAGAGQGNILPFIISCKEPIQVDRLGLIPLEINIDSLKNLFKIISGFDSKVYKRPAIQFGLIRVTYRLKGKLEQFYITDLKSSTRLFKQIELQFSRYESKIELNKLYDFLLPSTLISRTSTGVNWKYQ